jgi:hypothetical protein
MKWQNNKGQMWSKIKFLWETSAITDDIDIFVDTEGAKKLILVIKMLELAAF